MKKVLRSLTPKFDSKVSAIEEAKDLNALSLDEVYGSLIAFEMRVGKTNSREKEVSFKVEKTMKNQLEHEEDENLEVNFARKLQRGKGKYKGKLPFKCFNYGKIGYFAAKCPLNDENREKPYQEKKDKPKFRYAKGKPKRSLMTKNESSSEESSSEFSEEETNHTLFMAFLDEVIEECNTEIDLEGELIASLEELNKERKNNKETTKHLKESNELVVTLKVEIEELKRMVEQLEKENQMHLIYLWL